MALFRRVKQANLGFSPRRPWMHLIMERGISADTALRIARYFGMSVDFWTGIQVHYDTEIAKMQLGDRVKTEVKTFNPAA